jgi:hypothetical protein
VVTVGHKERGAGEGAVAMVAQRGGDAEWSSGEGDDRWGPPVS